MKKKPINQEYFDSESRARAYVLGAFYPCYRSTAHHSLSFTSSSRGLVEIVQKQLGSHHKPWCDSRSSSWSISIRNVPDLEASLIALGLGVPRIERAFPQNIPQGYLSHFVRGFMDGQAVVYTSNQSYTHVEIRFNKGFLQALHKVFSEHAKVERSEPSTDIVMYGHKDAIRIHNFIYQDWDYVKQFGLYVPSKKMRFKTEYPGDNSCFEHVIAAKKRVEEAKKLLRKGMRVYEVSEALGYSKSTVFLNAFKRYTGMSTKEWKRANCA